MAVLHLYMRLKSNIPVVRAGAQDALSQGRPADVEDLGQVAAKDLERLVRAGGQVVHTHILILTACRYHIPGEGERDGEIYMGKG